MKAFEKWESDDVCCNIKVDCGDLHCLSACKKIKETAWREALKWYWKTAEHISPSDYEILEKELEDEASQNPV